MSKTKQAKKNPKSVPHSRGVTLGMGVCSFLASVFDANESLKNSAGRSRKLTDEKILQMLKEEFPGRTSGIFTGKVTINEYRQRYNKGDFSLRIPPAKMSFRYDRSGRVVDGRSGLHLLPQEVIESFISHHETNRQKIITKAAKQKKQTKS